MKFLIGLILFFVLIYLLTKPVREILNAISGKSEVRHHQQRPNAQARTADRKSRAEDDKDDIVPDGAGEYVDFEEIKDDKK